MTKENKETDENLTINETMPHQINAPSFEDTGIKMQPPFVNEHGVVIGDSHYSSPNSPLENWTENTDPEVMAGDEWVHPTNDIGWNTAENRELLGKQKETQSLSLHAPNNRRQQGY